MKKQILSALGARSRRLVVVALLLPLALAGCSKPGESSSASGETATGEVSQAAIDAV